MTYTQTKECINELGRNGLEELLETLRKRIFPITLPKGEEDEKQKRVPRNTEVQRLGKL